MALSAAGLILVIVTLIFPPLGVYAIAGCGADLVINIILTILGYFPGHLHAFYLLYVLYDRRHHTGQGMPLEGEAPGVFSQEIQRGNVDGRVRIFDASRGVVEEKPALNMQ